MAATKAKDEKVITLGKTPQGQVVAETPGMSAPGMSAPGTQREFMGVYGKRLGDPGRHYG